ncbi:copper chaperone CopZ [Metabacillus litoralis]|uniref:copper chaperone CopZ n=1 Tax=Metabacillus litoralis TaxID=152268 RepID=UPI001CFD625E|nr:copper chaperone CopZ [Metabacillus litoralis]
MESVTMKVDGMSCNHCVNAVEGSVSKLQGVSLVKVNLENGSVEINYEQAHITLEQIKEAIEDQGYDVV